MLTCIFPGLVSITGMTNMSQELGYFCTSSGWFTHSEPHRTYTNHTFTELARCASTANCLYHPELVFQHPRHRDLWDGVVRVGSLCLNHPEKVPKHPTHLALSVVVCFL